MKTTVKVVYIILSIFFLVYLAIPNGGFPQKPQDSIRSDEPGDTETDLRRAYFTNMTREEVMNFYNQEISTISVLGIDLSPVRLNHPPEDAQNVIRDQTRSTFLEELVFPFRSGLYINGFEPTAGKDRILIQERVWRQKITVRLVESNVYARLLLGITCIAIIPFIYRSAKLAFVDFRNLLLRLWTYR